VGGRCGCTGGFHPLAVLVRRMGYWPLLLQAICALWLLAHIAEACPAPSLPAPGASCVIANPRG